MKGAVWGQRGGKVEVTGQCGGMWWQRGGKVEV